MIHLRISGPRADLEIDNPTRMNALSAAMWADLLDKLREVERRRDLAVLCLRGVGEAAFCAGGDITEYDDLARDRTRATAYHDLYRQVFATCRGLRIATIAAIPGYCLGAGLALAASCDFRIGTPQASFGITAVKRGLVYPVTEVTELVLLVGLPAVRAMILRGQRIAAARALALGLLDAVVARASLDRAVDELAAEMTASAGAAFANGKAVILKAQQLPREDAAVRRLLLGAFGSDEFSAGTAGFLGGTKPPARPKRASRSNV